MRKSYALRITHYVLVLRINVERLTPQLRVETRERLTRVPLFERSRLVAGVQVSALHRIAVKDRRVSAARRPIVTQSVRSVGAVLHRGQWRSGDLRNDRLLPWLPHPGV